MPRAKRGFKRRRRIKKVFDRAEGYDGYRRNTFRRTNENVVRAMVYAFRDRRVNKREFRNLWVERLSAAAAMNDISYSRLISALLKSSVAINRKMLSEIAIADPAAFSSIVNTVRANAPAH